MFSLLKCLLISLALHVFLLSQWLPFDPQSGGAQKPLVKRSVQLSLARSAAQELIDEAGQQISPLPVAAPVWPGGDDPAALHQGAAIEARYLLPDTARVAGESSGQPVIDQAPAPEALGEYRLNLARAARNFRQYPTIARELGQQGVVVLVVTTVAGVARPRVGLSQSSGSPALDKQALSMVDQAIFIASLPEGLKGKPFALTLPIHFSLAEAVD